MGEVTRMKTGPNDIRCIIWALGEYFLPFLHNICRLELPQPD